ncbi:MAG: redox-regulated ATPase YchF [Candidatus Heimdallarchaeota archaeon]|nr:redox-regulated ATPase YchF [Candidatus Heimdallarchaeota archaeon]
MLVGVVGKPSSGKSTILNALCMTDAKMGAYPFTTVKANRGVGYVTVTCPCTTLETSCTPRTGKCENGLRYLPIEILDVPGLVPGASEGKGMGNQFLDDLRQADMLIHVVDVSGTTDEEGNEVDTYDPLQDIRWVDEEIIKWISNTLYKGWDRVAKKLEADRTKLYEVLQEKLSGLGATVLKVKTAVRTVGIGDKNPREWTEEERYHVVKELKALLFPMIIAANKIDKSTAEEHFDKMKQEFPQYQIIGTSGLAELTLRKLDKAGIISYIPGSSSIDIKDPTHKQIAVASTIQEKLLDIRQSTGVNQLLHDAVFDYLNLVAVFPVEDTTHFTDKDGRVLPDAFLVPKGTTAKQFAGKIHSDLADRFINAILANQNNKRISATYELEQGDVVKIVSAVK